MIRTPAKGIYESLSVRPSDPQDLIVYDVKGRVTSREEISISKNNFCLASQLLAPSDGIVFRAETLWHSVTFATPCKYPVPGTLLPIVVVVVQGTSAG